MFLAENRLKYRENGTIDLIFNYWGKIKVDKNFYDGRNFCQNILGIIGASMRLFETGFKIFISAMVISKSAVDLEYLIIQTEVRFVLLYKFAQKIQQLLQS